MTGIKLDPRTLLGFKIIGAGESVTKLHSPKIGAKGCPSIEPDAMQPTSGRIPKA